jgi:hypothetical protein
MKRGARMSNVEITLLPLPETPIPPLVTSIALTEEYRLAVASLSALEVDAVHRVWFTLARADVEADVEADVDGAGRDVTYTVRRRVEAGERWAYWASVTQLLRDLRAGAAAINAVFNAAAELRFDDVELSLACAIRFGAGGAPGNSCAAGWRLEQFLLALEHWARGCVINARATAQAPAAPGQCPRCGLMYEERFPPHIGLCHSCQDIQALCAHSAM